MSHREGNNFCIRITAWTLHGNSTTEVTDDLYNTFDDLKLFVLEHTNRETFAQMDEDCTFYAGANLILDERNSFDGVTYAYKLVSKNPTPFELRQDADHNAFIAENLK